MKTKIPELSTGELQKFIFTFSGIVALIFGLIVPMIFEAGFSWWPWVISSFFVAWGVFLPSSVRPFYRIWMKFGLVMNFLVNRVVLGIVFFCVLVPFGFVFKLRKVDFLKRKWKGGVDSYREDSDNPDPSHMERPF